MSIMRIPLKIFVIKELMLTFYLEFILQNIMFRSEGNA